MRYAASVFGFFVSFGDFTLQIEDYVRSILKICNPHLSRIVQTGRDSVDGCAQRILQLRSLFSLLFAP